MMGISEIRFANENPDAWRDARRKSREDARAELAKENNNLLKDVPADYWTGHEPNAVRDQWTDSEISQGLNIPSPSAAYKPSHGGYPTSPLDDSRNPNPVPAINPNEFSPADDDGRMTAKPYKIGVGLPPIYFDAVSAHNALDDIVHETQEQIEKLDAAMQTVRLNEASPQSVKHLTEVYNAISASADIRARMVINEMANTIDHMERETGYYVSPIDRLKGFIASLRAIFANTDG